MPNRKKYCKRQKRKELTMFTEKLNQLYREKLFADIKREMTDNRYTCIATAKWDERSAAVVDYLLDRNGSTIPEDTFRRDMNAETLRRDCGAIPQNSDDETLDLFCSLLKEETDLYVERAADKDVFPNISVYDREGDIIAYMHLMIHKPDMCVSPSSNCYSTLKFPSYEQAKAMQAISETKPEPVFVIHWAQFPCIKDIFYETAEDMLKRAEGKGAEIKNIPEEAVTAECYYSDVLNLQRFEKLFCKLMRRMKNDCSCAQSG